jgi:CubicO group peptidase (beta-lactamase class C family)
MVFAACQNLHQKNSFTGFWQGPHPEDPDKKFYVEIKNLNDTLMGRGYWTKNNFYQSQFDVDGISIRGDSIDFFIPMWNCLYTGKLKNDSLIRGGFNCLGESFDSVDLVQYNRIENVLNYPKPECKNENYSYKYQVPEVKKNNLAVSKYTSVGDSGFIVQLVNEIIEKEYGRINSFLVFKNNKLICEVYFYGYSQTDLHPIESCTKSVTSLLIGIAFDKGFIRDIQEPVFKIFPEFPHLKSATYRELTIEHLLTMTSGFEIQNDQNFQIYNRIDDALKRNIKYKPGTTFQYDGSNAEILGAILKQKTGFYPDEFAEKYLFAPLLIENYTWDGYNNERFPLMSGSLCLQPRDMLKMGILVLNNGRFNKQPVLSEKWVKQSTSIKTKTHIPGDDYSYQWWNLHFVSNEKTYDVIWANGWGSQFIYIIPEIDVVIVTTGHNYEYDSWAISDGIRKYLYLLDENANTKTELQQP